MRPHGVKEQSAWIAPITTCRLENGHRSVIRSVLALLILESGPASVVLKIMLSKAISSNN